MYAEKDKIKSKRFSFLIKEDFLKTKPTSEDAAKTAVEDLNKDDTQEFIKNFYKECRDISQLIFGKINHPNHWEKIVKKFLEKDNTDIKEKEARYFRDAWVACSDSGEDSDIDLSWPYQKEIKTKKDRWNDKK
ncbi:hypothetical protein MHSWG343_09040 [Candidatus Mycoplasma haematohominis]|uniref:Uncharacterized protein n=1 Tax=Candidatus Mycoplasma haematohominis TaxID=1494318 RepID=A0A478FRS4_9MOLU|nr:hypothetical protein MHSWG343_09040 [Candidatus Mycoplasma haemohominis]